MITREGHIEFPQINQQATQMFEVALCIVNKLQMRVSGQEGLNDLRIVEAIYKASKTGGRLAL